MIEHVDKFIAQGYTSLALVVDKITRIDDLDIMGVWDKGKNDGMQTHRTMEHRKTIMRSIETLQIAAGVWRIVGGASVHAHSPEQMCISLDRSWRAVGKCINVARSLADSKQKFMA